ncbi:SprT family zinc-dependent metalloprotease [uncultured Pseudoteredinibacter sp.]|uniref:M48 family metallopeptidase n=1 Tax=uncultured Pseudoteredinibacter sp. TaxID=1641701 RepID=UPI00261ABFE7|nr:SprT family zinc-dependent metalloprotease [uncultured Pseudoteredinibacter sp.]
MIESKASRPELPGIQLIRSKRKSLAITIEAGRVIVRAPLRLPKSEIQAFILKKQAWILRTVKSQSEQLAEVPQRQYIDGEYLPWRGRSLCLRLKPRKRITERIGDELYTSIAEKSQIEERVQAWYRKESKLVLTQKVERLTAAHGLKFAEVKVRKNKRRWGHCTSKGVLQFNWLIMLAPESVIDYLVAHEVAHLRHFNHGPEFWRLVACFEPDYQQAQAWLKENGHLLVL